MNTSPLSPQKLLIVKAEQMQQEVEHEGVIELEEKTILENLSDFFGVFLLELL
jgi:hypothetical protein